MVENYADNNYAHMLRLDLKKKLSRLVQVFFFVRKE